jgi:3-oxoadipate enol-lactonase
VGAAVRCPQVSWIPCHAPDLCGFGERRLEPEPYSHVRDLVELPDRPTAVMGNSLGGRVALELAALYPRLVERLVLIAPGLPGWNWSAETRAHLAEEEAAYERGDLRAAAEASVSMWIVGPSRSSEAVESEVREAARAMILRSYEMQQAWDEAVEEALDSPVNERLGEIDRPTLVIVGDEDIADTQAIAEHVAADERDGHESGWPGVVLGVTRADREREIDPRGSRLSIAFHRRLGCSPADVRLGCPSVRECHLT